MTGEIEVWVEDGGENGGENGGEGELIQARLRADDGQDYRLDAPAGLELPDSGSFVRVSGVLDTCGNAEILSIDSVESLQPLELAAQALGGTFGEQKIAVILLSFQDQATSYTQAQARDVVFNQVDGFWRENSFGQTSATGDVFGPYTIPVSKVGCDSGAISSAAQAAVAAAGVSLSQYRRWVYVYPKNGCSWYGLGTIGGNPSKAWINGALQRFTVGHELGHNLGLHHARSLNCGVTTLAASAGTACSVSEYGDTTDTMGNKLAGHYNAYMKERLGWLGTESSPLISYPEFSGAQWIDPYETDGSGVKALKLYKGKSSSGANQYYYVEFRQPVGFDSVFSSTSNSNNLTTGVVIHQGSTTASESSHLLNMNPATGTFYKAALQVGQIFEDIAAGIKLTLLSAQSGGAQLDVQFAKDVPPPPPPGDFPAPPPGRTGSIPCS